MKVKISFEIDYNLPEKTSREIKNVFMENIKVFYENNLPIAKRALFIELSEIKITDDYKSQEKE